MNKSFVILLVALGLLLAGCTQTPPAPTTAPTSATTVSGSSPASAASIEISGYAFNLASITVARGATVTWMNKDAVAHTITADDGSFSSDAVASGKTYSHTFNIAGSFAYHCAIHPSMKGVITVQ